MKPRFFSVAIKALPAAMAAAWLTGCDHMPLLDPKGPVGRDERFVMIAAIALMLIVVIPVVIMVVWFPRKYRASNAKATYAPQWSSARIEWAIWMIPAGIVVVLTVLMSYYTFRLDPYKPIPSDREPVRIEVVSLDWKWLFIYPDQQIATVNKLVFPARAPISFRITSATVMTSFFIPRLGSQIYAMAGMQTRLNLMAEEEGTYNGQNQQFSGSGYADMTFKAEAVTPDAFNGWVRTVRESSQRLDAERYRRLAIESHGHPITLFSWVAPGLFDGIVRQSHSSSHQTLTGWHQRKDPDPATNRLALAAGGGR